MVQNSDFFKISFFTCETYFFLCNSMSSIEPSRKKKKNHAEILDCRPPTYTVNTLKFEYLGPRTPRVAPFLKFGSLAMIPLIRLGYVPSFTLPLLEKIPFSYSNIQ